MGNEFIARVRQEQTRQELELVSKAINIGLEKFIDADPSGLHRTQLEAVRSVLDVAVRELRSHLNDIKLEILKVEEVYELCRDYDEAIIWLQRLWEYLKEKFEQRYEDNGQGERARVLKSADEVVWSCFHPILTKALGQHSSAPLTYIEPEYSPATIQSDKPLPFDLMLTADLDFLNECLESLPIPVLRLPPVCISGPWWLVFVGHEVGHHIQHALDLVGYFRLGLSNVAQAQGFSSEEAAQSWGKWGEEIFADLFSILMLGPWAVRAMAEVEIGTKKKMVKRKATYPSPVIRLALMKRAAEELGLDPGKELLGLDLEGIADADEFSHKDYQVVAGAISFALQPLAGEFGTLKDLCSFDPEIFADGGKISGWSAVLSAKEGLQIDSHTMQRLETAREVICGSLCAWSQHSQGTEQGDLETSSARRKEKREIIKQNTLDALMKSGPRETRAGDADEDVEPEKKGKTLADLLKQKARRAN